MRVPESDRQSIWSVATGWLPAYFALFDALGWLGTAFVIARNLFWLQHPTVHDMIWAIIVGIVIVGAASATISILIVELGKNAMIVGTYLEEMIKKRRARQMAEAVERGRSEGIAKGRSEGVAEGIVKGRSEGRSEGRAEGAAEISARIREWNDRRLAAEAKGEPFDEPPPGL